MVTYFKGLYKKIMKKSIDFFSCDLLSWTCVEVSLFWPVCQPIRWQPRLCNGPGLCFCWHGKLATAEVNGNLAMFDRWLDNYWNSVLLFGLTPQGCLRVPEKSNGQEKVEVLSRVYIVVWIWTDYRCNK